MLEDYGHEAAPGALHSVLGSFSALKGAALRSAATSGVANSRLASYFGKGGTQPAAPAEVRGSAETFAERSAGKPTPIFNGAAEPVLDEKDPQEKMLRRVTEQTLRREFKKVGIPPRASAHAHGRAPLGAQRRRSRVNGAARLRLLARSPPPSLPPSLPPILLPKKGGSGIPSSCQNKSGRGGGARKGSRSPRH